MTSLFQPAAPPVNGDAGGIGSQGTNAQTLGTLFYSSAAASVVQIWYYSAPVEVTDAAGLNAITSLPTTVGLFDPSGTVLYQDTSPVWSGAPASGWVSTDITSTAIDADTEFIAAVEGDSFDDGGGYWNAYSYGYFGSGSPGDTGVTNGILTAPGQDSASNASPQGFNHNSAGDGTAGTLQFPSGNYANANWWVDVTVTEATTPPPDTGGNTVGGGTQGMFGSGTLGISGPDVLVSGLAPGGSQGVSAVATFSSNSTGPGNPGDGGNPGGSNPGFDSVNYPDWFRSDSGLDARVELQIGDQWLDFTDRVLIGDNIVIGRGHPDESTTAAPSTLSGTLDNHDGVMSSLNPYSPYFGRLGLNTPIRVSVPDASAHMRLEDDNRSYANFPAINGLESFEIWVDADADNWHRDQVLASQWDDTTNQCSWFLNTLASGQLELSISLDGTPVGGSWSCLSFPLPVTHGRISIRVTYDSTTGKVVFYSGKFCQSWQATAASSLPAGGPQATRASVEVGYATNGAQRGLPGFQGKIYAFALLDTIGGTVADNAKAAADFTALTPGVTSWGAGWTLQGTAEVTDRNYRFHGECGAWPQSWTPGDPNARITLAAGGLLRRLGSSGTNVNSCMYRAYTNVTNAGVEGYWPFEDGSHATQLASAVGGTPFRWYGPAPSVSAFSGFNCSAPIVTFNGSSLVGTIAPYTPTNAAVVRFLLNVPVGGDTTGTLATIYYSGSNLATVNLGYTNGGGLGLSGWDAQGNQLFATGAVAFGVDGELLRVSVEVTNNSNGTCTADILTITPGGTFAEQFPVAGLSGSAGMVSKIIFNPQGKLTGTSVGHVSVESQWTSLGELGRPLNAYDGEAAGVRFQRLCAEEGIPFRGVGNILDTVPMGPQKIEPLAALIQECVDADLGAWVETRQVLGWGYRTRASMGNQYAAASFDYNQDHLSDDLSPTVDDQVVKNDITVSGADGSSSRKVLDDGSGRSVSRIGRYDTTFTVNVPDEQLESQAGWRLHSLTVDEPRYKQISIDLANSAIAELYWDILGTDLGDRVTVQNPPVWLPPGLIDQLAQYSGETIGLKGFRVQWNGIPSTPWNVAYMDDVVFGHADTDGSELASDVSATDTTMLVYTIDGASPLWTTDSADFPFDINVGGERITVTGISGNSSPQTFTVTRSANGVSKGHASGTDVRLWTPAIISL